MKGSPLNVGDEVLTQFSGRTTRHVITDRIERQSQTGVLFRVTPEIPGNRDDDNPYFDGYVDSAWFVKVERQLELL